MSLEIRALIETAVADGTLVRGLLHVQDLVNSQSATLTKSLPALHALEGLLLGVDVPEKRERMKLELKATERFRVSVVVAVDATSSS